MEPYQNPVPRKHCWTRHSLWAEFPSLKFFMFLLSGTSGSQREQGECSDMGTETASVRCLCSLDIRIGIHFSCVAEGGVCSSESEWRNLWFRCDLREQGTGNQFLSLHGKQKGAENTWFLLQNVRCCLPWWIHETLLLEHVHDTRDTKEVTPDYRRALSSQPFQWIYQATQNSWVNQELLQYEPRYSPRTGAQVLASALQ